MKQLLIEILSTLGYPVILQGTMAEDAQYPESFITFFTIGSPSAADFENETALTAWQYTVSFYSSSPELVESKAAEIRTILKAAGFIPQGRGRDIPSDISTHTGWTCDYRYLQNYMEV